MRRDSPREVVERNCLGKRYAECSLFPDLDDRARLYEQKVIELIREYFVGEDNIKRIIGRIRGGRDGEQKNT